MLNRSLTLCTVVFFLPAPPRSCLWHAGLTYIAGVLSQKRQRGRSETRCYYQQLASALFLSLCELFVHWACPPEYMPHKGGLWHIPSESSEMHRPKRNVVPKAPIHPRPVCQSASVQKKRIPGSRRQPYGLPLLSPLQDLGEGLGESKHVLSDVLWQAREEGARRYFLQINLHHLLRYPAPTVPDQFTVFSHHEQMCGPAGPERPEVKLLPVLLGCRIPSRFKTASKRLRSVWLELGHKGCVGV